MKGRINQIAAGTVIIKKPELSFTPASLAADIPAGVISSHTVAIKNSNNSFFKCFFYSDNPRVRISTQQPVVHNTMAAIEINTVNCEIDDKITGSISVISNAGEYKIPYDIRVIASESKMHMPASMQELFQLYRISPYDAVRTFISQDFLKTAFMENNIKALAEYEALRKGMNEHQALEEFLIYQGLKEPVSIESDESIKKIEVTDEYIEEVATVKASSWGYIKGRIKTDSDWIILSRDTFSFVDFINQEAKFVYRIDTSKLHAGINYGCIRFKTYNAEKKICLEVKKQGGAKPRKSLMLPAAVLMSISRLILMYVSDCYEEAVVLSNLLQIVNDNIKKYPSDIRLHIVRAWLMFKDNRKDEAKALLEWCIKSIGKNRFMQEEYCICSGIYAIVTGKKRDAENARALINECCQNTHSLTMSLLEIYLVKELNDKEIIKELRQLNQQYRSSAAVYTCAAKLYTGNPRLLEELGSFELRVFYYMLRNKCLSDEVCERILTLPLGKYDNEALFCRAFIRLYQEKKDNRVLSAICASLIRQGKYGPKYAGWYEKGLHQKLPIACLNDAYMHSISWNRDTRIPVNILMYCSYKSEFSNEQLIKLYGYILDNYTPENEVYKVYADQMNKFAIKRLLDGKIDGRLVKLYDNILKPEFIDSHIGNVIPELLYLKKIKTSLPFVYKAVIHYPQLKTEFSVKMRGMETEAAIFTKDAAVIFEDAYGNRYSDPDVQISDLMNRPDLVSVCHIMNPDHLMLLLGSTQEFYKRPLNSQEELKTAGYIIGMEEIEPSFKNVLVHRMADYCFVHEEKETRDFNEWLISLNLSAMESGLRAEVIEIYIERGYIEQAYKGIRAYGSETVSLPLLLKFAVRYITENVYEYDEMILNICSRLIRNNQINITMLAYMSMYFNGVTEDMFRLLSRTQEVKSVNADFAQRVITQMMFTGECEHLDEAYDIYAASCRPQENIKRAYLVLKCHDYVTNNCKISDKQAGNLEDQFVEAGRDMIPTVYRMALLLYYSSCDTITARQKKICENLLYSFCSDEIFMECYHTLGKHIELPHQMEGKRIIQYKGKENKTYIVCAELGYGKRHLQQKMKEIYPGIFSAAVFMFQDEDGIFNIDSISEDGTSDNVESIAVSSDICYCRTNSRYDDISKLIRIEKDGSIIQWKKQCEKNIMWELATDKLFVLI